MKKIIFITFLLFLSSMLARGQGYVPMLDTNKVWNIHHDLIWQGYTYSYYLVIDENDHTKFILKEERHPQDIHTLGYFIEDTVSRRVYFTDIINNVEVLLYDFGLDKGDVFDYMEVTKVDSIQLLDGTYRKRIEFEEGFYPYWIEGIGSIKGGLLRINWQYMKDTSKAWVLCYYENNNLLYMNDDFDNCNINFIKDNVETMDKSTHPLIYPNPFSQIISISFNYPLFDEKTEVIVKAIDGRIVINETLHPDNSVDLSSLVKGIYLLIINNSGIHYTTKIVKH